MKCPRCWSEQPFERYEFDKEKKKWVHKLYCAVCYNREVYNVKDELDDMPLEDYVEYRLQSWLFTGLHRANIKDNIIDCFEDGKTYINGTHMEYDGRKVHCQITIKPEEDY